jgi:hypothetical protein
MERATASNAGSRRHAAGWLGPGYYLVGSIKCSYGVPGNMTYG